MRSRATSLIRTASSTAPTTTLRGAPASWPSRRRWCARGKSPPARCISCSRRRKNRGCWAPSITPPIRCCRWTRWRPTSISTGSIIWERRAISCCSAPIDRRLDRWRQPSPRSAAARSGAISIPNAATFSAPTIFRLPRPACPRCRSANHASSLATMRSVAEKAGGVQHHRLSPAERRVRPGMGFQRCCRRHASAGGAGLARRGGIRHAAIQRRRPVRQRAKTIVTFVSLADIEAASTAHPPARAGDATRSKFRGPNAPPHRGSAPIFRPRANRRCAVPEM